MMNTTQRFPRPKPRFAGATELVLIGVESVVTGLSEGEVGMVVGGVLLLLLVAVAGGVWWRWIRPRRRQRTPPASPSHGEEGLEMESISALHSFAPTPSPPTRL